MDLPFLVIQLSFTLYLDLLRCSFIANKCMYRVIILLPDGVVILKDRSITAKLLSITIVKCIFKRALNHPSLNKMC